MIQGLNIGVPLSHNDYRCPCPNCGYAIGGCCTCPECGIRIGLQIDRLDYRLRRLIVSYQAWQVIVVVTIMLLKGSVTLVWWRDMQRIDPWSEHIDALWQELDYYRAIAGGVDPSELTRPPEASPITAPKYDGLQLSASEILQVLKGEAISASLGATALLLSLVALALGICALSPFISSKAAKFSAFVACLSLVVTVAYVASIWLEAVL